ncbi:putative nucleoporin p58/p45 [Helianthus annuus]|nr:putative nucleoporin p58/p45 [Helianthus annuus]
MAFSFTPQQQQTTSLFQPQQQSPFQPSGGTPLFQPQQQQQQQQQQLLQQQQQQQQSQLFLFTNEKTPANYGTKWADLHPDSQKFLLQIEERILEYRDESQRLDQCGRLYDSSVSNDGFELDASHIVQELCGISTAMDRQKVLLQDLTATVKDMLRNTEIAVRSFMMLRSKFLHQNKTSAATTSQPAGATTTLTTTSQPTTSAVVPVYDFYSGMPRKPSLFLQQTVARFDKYLAECRQWIEELEQLLLQEANKNAMNSNSSLLQSLPKVMSNVHDFFVYVAAKVESIHQYMESMKTAYLADQRGRGDGNDPFLEADRRETAKQVAAARRVHPTLHLPSNSQPSTQAAGSLLAASSATPATSAAPPASAPAATGGSGLFSTPFSSTSSSSIFSTPATSAPSFPLFQSSGASPQTSIFGPSSSSTPSLFNSTPAATGSSLFSTPFTTNPSTGASAFSTPFGTGPATGSGASFNTLSKNRGTKSRTGRR